jgi:hypothetical protein
MYRWKMESILEAESTREVYCKKGKRGGKLEKIWSPGGVEGQSYCGDLV